MSSPSSVDFVLCDVVARIASSIVALPIVMVTSVVISAATIVVVVIVVIVVG